MLVGHAALLKIDIAGFGHARRATAAINALDHEADIAEVQGWLGHASIATTRIYDQRKIRSEDSPTLKSFISLILCCNAANLLVSPIFLEENRFSPLTKKRAFFWAHVNLLYLLTHKTRCSMQHALNPVRFAPGIEAILLVVLTLTTSFVIFEVARRHPRWLATVRPWQG